MRSAVVEHLEGWSFQGGVYTRTWTERERGQVYMQGCRYYDRPRYLAGKEEVKTWDGIGDSEKRWVLTEYLAVV